MPPALFRSLYPAIVISLATLVTTNAQTNLVDTPTLLLPGTVPKIKPSRGKVIIPPIVPPPPTTTPTPLVRPTDDSHPDAKLRHQSKKIVLQSQDYDDWTTDAAPPPSSVIHFSKSLYSSLAAENATTLADHFRPAFESLNQDGRLADTLNILYDMRLMDLQTSVKHARKMKDIIDILAE
jgi:hypothetical protein